MNKIESGFFTMDDVHTIMSFKQDLVGAKLYCTRIVADFEKTHPQVHLQNVLKAQRMISSAKTVDKLALAVSNFLLAHTSEDLAVI